MSANQILFKVEDALETIIGDLEGFSSVTLHKSSDTDNCVVPYGAIMATQATPRAYRSGNFMVAATVELHTSATEATRADRVELAGILTDGLQTDTIAADLTATRDDFTAFDCLTSGQAQRIEGQRHVYVLTLQIVCCGSDV